MSGRRKNVYKCDLCGMKCKQKSKAEEHFNSYAHAKKAEGNEHWDLKFQSILCPECSIGFLNCKDFREHYNLKHLDDSKIDLQKQQVVMNEKNSENILKKNIKVELQENDIVIQADDEHSCHLCNEKFRQEKHLQLHMKTKHKRGRKRKRPMFESTTTSDFDCKICNNMSHGSQKKLELHFQSYTHAKNAKDDPEEDLRDQTITCTRCNEDFSNCKEFRYEYNDPIPQCSKICKKCNLGKLHSLSERLKSINVF